MLKYTSTFHLDCADYFCKAKDVSYTFDGDFGTKVQSKMQNVILYLPQNFFVVFFCDIKCFPTERGRERREQEIV